MRRWIYHYEVVDGDPARLDEILREQVTELLAKACGEQPASQRGVDGSILLTLDASIAGLHAEKTVRLSTGVATRDDGRTCIPISWHAEPARRAFPAFEGVLELQPLSANVAQLTLSGSYTAPGSLVGAAADAMGLHGIADQTVRTLVRGLAAALEQADPVPADATLDLPPSERLILRVRDVMTPDPVVIDEGMPLRQAALLLISRRIAGAPVVDVAGGLVGVLSGRDLIEREALPPSLSTRRGGSSRRRSALTAGEACTRPALTTYPDAPVRAAAREMLDAGVSRLVVVDGSAVSGIISRQDVLEALVRSDAEVLGVIRRILSTLAEPEVEATIAWGHVTLAGMTKLRSRLPAIVRMIEQIDGVMTVEADLSWHTDDLIPPVGGAQRA